MISARRFRSERRSPATHLQSDPRDDHARDAEGTEKVTRTLPTRPRCRRNAEASDGDSALEILQLLSVVWGFDRGAPRVRCFFLPVLRFSSRGRFADLTRRDRYPPYAEGTVWPATNLLRTARSGRPSLGRVGRSRNIASVRGSSIASREPSVGRRSRRRRSGRRFRSGAARQLSGSTSEIRHAADDRADLRGQRRRRFVCADADDAGRQAEQAAAGDQARLRAAG